MEVCFQLHDLTLNYINNKLSLCQNVTNQRHVGGVEIKLHTFLSSALDGS